MSLSLCQIIVTELKRNWIFLNKQFKPDNKLPYIILDLHFPENLICSLPVNSNQYYLATVSLLVGFFFQLKKKSRYLSITLPQSTKEIAWYILILISHSIKYLMEFWLRCYSRVGWVARLLIKSIFVSPE